mmetsp:Transcript_23237/g.52180  ORF Transcript_23237/g.52180 Transcript_23237/m.52180 type:complete len:398 (+) Transcript_23237:331-1524(+)
MPAELIDVDRLSLLEGLQVKVLDRVHDHGASRGHSFGDKGNTRILHATLDFDGLEWKVGSSDDRLAAEGLGHVHGDQARDGARHESINFHLPELLHVVGSALGDIGRSKDISLRNVRVDGVHTCPSPHELASNSSSNRSAAMHHNSLAMKVLEHTLDSTQDSVSSGIVGVYSLVRNGRKNIGAVLGQAIHISRGSVQIASSVHGSIQLMQESSRGLHQFALVNVQDRLVRSRGIADNLGSCESSVVGCVLDFHALRQADGFALSSLKVRVHPKTEPAIARTIPCDLGSSSNHQVDAEVWEGPLQDAGRMLELFREERSDHGRTSIVGFQVVPCKILSFLVGKPGHLVYAANRDWEICVPIPLLCCLHRSLRVVAGRQALLNIPDSANPAERARNGVS